VGIRLKKRYGQHFLRDQSVVDAMIREVNLNKKSSVLEIGCGDGFLTRSILKKDIACLWIFEIDEEWAEYVKKEYASSKLTVHTENVLEVDFKRLEGKKPWTLLSNLPYQVTFPILHIIQKNRNLFLEGVVMVQEEVAQKILKTSGRGYGFISIFFQHFFEWKLLLKIPPTAFEPPPKVYSRLLYFKPRKKLDEIEDEENFWKFIKIIFRQPRRTLRNNLKQAHYDASQVDEKILGLRAQELGKTELISLWCQISAR